MQVALNKTENNYGKAKLEPTEKIMNELLIFKKFIYGTENINIMVGPTSGEDEKLLEPVRIHWIKNYLDI